MALQTLEHFDTIDSEHLERLSGARSTLCASIYLPTHRCGNDVQQDPIRLKNAVAEARRQFVEFGQSGDDADDLLRPAVELMVLDAYDFWQHQSDGLAILLSAEEACLFQLPTKFDEEVAVSDRFRLKPLLRSMNSNEEFHLVAVSRGAVRVFRGCRSGLKEEHFSDLPESLQEFSSHDQQRGHNWHSFKVRANSADSSVPHGHVENKEEADLRQYFREIKNALPSHFKTVSGPVVFAGVEELFPYFRSAFDDCSVLDEYVAGNPDDLSNDQLLKKAWPLVQQQCDSTCAAVVDRFKEASGTDFGSTCLKTIVEAAYRGRIDTLLLKHGERNYGTCDKNGMVDRSDEVASADTYDLYDIAAIRTLRADGRVVFIDDEAMESPVAAIFRYVA
ncbi:MAG: hypothetical protein KDB01_08470 [Planctomycetaceae bacterium]|nr:hypothetical protein [Planctomycetaceae bacterium]